MPAHSSENLFGGRRDLIRGGWIAVAGLAGIVSVAAGIWGRIEAG